MKKKCACVQLPERPTSMDYNNRYLSMLKCPIHAHVPNRLTKRYENAGKGKWDMTKPNQTIYHNVFVVAQAVGLKQVGIKTFDMPSGWRAVSAFPTRDDARAYLLDVLDTVKREQKMGLRTKRNLDPKFVGGLDFRICPTILAIAKNPLVARGWDLSMLPHKEIKRKKS